MVSIDDLKIRELGIGVICKEESNYYLEFDPNDYSDKAELSKIEENEYHYIQIIKIYKEPKEIIPSRGNLKYLGDGKIEIPSQYIITPNRPPWEGQYEVGELLFFIFEELYK